MCIQANDKFALSFLKSTIQSGGDALHRILGYGNPQVRVGNSKRANLRACPIGGHAVCNDHFKVGARKSLRVNSLE